jgi:hypothetical protein
MEAHTRILQEKASVNRVQLILIPTPPLLSLNPHASLAPVTVFLQKKATKLQTAYAVQAGTVRMEVRARNVRLDFGAEEA